MGLITRMWWILQVVYIASVSAYITTAVIIKAQQNSLGLGTLVDISHHKVIKF